MFSYISGRIAERGTNFVVADVNGVGFKIFTSLNTLQDSTISVGEKATLYTSLYIKEGIMDLYGFSTKEELNMFELLITVSGVGAKGAISILSVAPPSKLALAIVTGDIATIKQASGIGPKTAQRISLELKDKIKNESIVSADNTDAFTPVMPIGNSAQSEAISALMVLGYSASEAQKAVSSAGDIDNVEDIIKIALKKLF
ncbi:MAG: Holliday junction branch migration protein RuvA [Clostridia bacterium]|nr:Holliday junction branch migration protein RuvA [Clostridia bacterium]